MGLPGADDFGVVVSTLGGNMASSGGSGREGLSAASGTVPTLRGLQLLGWAHLAPYLSITGFRIGRGESSW